MCVGIYIGIYMYIYIYVYVYVSRASRAHSMDGSLASACSQWPWGRNKIVGARALSLSLTHTHMYVCICMYMYIYIYVCIHVSRLAHIRLQVNPWGKKLVVGSKALTHTHIHTHTLTALARRRGQHGRRDCALVPDVPVQSVYLR